MMQKLLVQGMSCQHCKKNIESTLQELPGVNKVTAHHDAGFVDIDFDEDKITLETIVDEIEDLGFDVNGEA